MLAIGVAISGAIVFISDRWIFPFPYDRLYRMPATFVYDRQGTLLRCFLSTDQFWRKPAKLEDISPLLIQSVLAREDRWFHYHPGVNLFSLVQAAVDNIRAGKIVRGGSTITMQIARMIEPKPRTIKSKIVEILRTLQLELHYSKDELLTFYFNLAPYGGNIEGIGAAAYFYFGKSPGELTPAQAALLTAIPNSPNSFCPGENMADCYNLRDRVLGVMKSKHIISQEQYADARLEEIPSRLISPPLLAPHVTRDLALANPGRPEIVTTIDSHTQEICEKILNSHKAELQMKNIHNASVVVMDVKSGEVLAVIGSLDFFDEKHSGLINGSMAGRSPGSALKPFLYALAFDRGVISPSEFVEDLPVYYSGYSPQNYDDVYRGVVSAADALKMSLNVPAVNICARVGLKEYFGLLKRGGLTTLRGDYLDYGLPFVLGACDIKLIELTNLYRTLANGGIYSRYRLIYGDDHGEYDTLFSESSCYILSEILADLARPEFPSSWEFSDNIPRIAWKTGTSYGRRDAWSMGYNPKYVVGVWVGNFSGEPSPELVGAETAAPILFDIFTSLNAKSKNNWFGQPHGVGIREVCGVSGKPPGAYCPATIEALYIKDVSPVQSCEIHQPFMVDRKTGNALCRFCSEGKQVENMVCERWPAEISSWFEKSGVRLADIPPHNPDCRGVSGGDRPIINSPRPDVTYVLRDYLPADQQGILLDVSVAGGASYVFWFIDDVLFKSVLPGEKIFYIPEIGHHSIVCSDDQGRSTAMELIVN